MTAVTVTTTTEPTTQIRPGYRVQYKGTNADAHGGPYYVIAGYYLNGSPEGLRYSLFGLFNDGLRELWDVKPGSVELISDDDVKYRTCRRCRTNYTYIPKIGQSADCPVCNLRSA